MVPDGVGAGRVSQGPSPAPSSSQNRTCEFPRIRLKHSKGRWSDPAVSCSLEPSMKIGSWHCFRNTHLQPPHLLVDRPPIDGRPGEARGRAGRVHGRLSPSLVKTVLQALSRRSTCWTWAPFRAGNVAPVSDSLQVGIGFFQHPVPHLRRRSSRSACLRADSCRTGTTLASEEGEKIGPCSDRNDPGRRELNAPRRGGKIGPNHRSGGDTGFPRSAPEVHAGVGACCRPGAASDREGLPFSAPSGHLHLLVQAAQPLWLVLT